MSPTPAEILAAARETGLLSATTKPLTCSPSESGSLHVEQLLNVDPQGRSDGSILIFDEATQMWKTTNLLVLQIIDGGEY